MNANSSLMEQAAHTIIGLGCDVLNRLGNRRQPKLLKNPAPSDARITPDGPGRTFAYYRISPVLASGFAVL
jgi:hypothetical protein